MEDRNFAEVRNCRECRFDSICKSYYGGLHCNPAPKEKKKEDTESESRA